jgi:hypothetical protein
LDSLFLPLDIFSDHRFLLCHSWGKCDKELEIRCFEGSH